MAEHGATIDVEPQVAYEKEHSMRSKSRPLLFILCGLISCSFPMFSYATVWAKLDIEELVRLSDAVVVGTVVSRVELSAEEAPVPISLYTVEVSNVLRGSVEGEGSRFEMPVFGGCFGQECVSIAGTPDLEVDSKYVFFLGRVGHRLVPFVGGEQGLLRVEDGELGERVYGYDGHSLSISNGALVRGTSSSLFEYQAPEIVNHVGESVVVSPYQLEAVSTASLSEVVDLINQNLDLAPESKTVLSSEFEVLADSPWNSLANSMEAQADVAVEEICNE